MEIFISGETYGKGSGLWIELSKQGSELLEQLKEKNYGEGLDSIGIISILLPEEFFEEGGYPERRYYSRKRKDADIRLRINYRKFIVASKEKRREIYMNHIIESIRVAGEKAGKGFDTERLIEDVENILTEDFLTVK